MRDDHLVERHWNEAQAFCSGARAANCAILDYMQGAGITRVSRPSSHSAGVIASFEHPAARMGYSILTYAMSLSSA